MYGYYGYGLYDPTMILVLIGAVLSLWASAKVKNTFNRYTPFCRFVLKNEHFLNL